jgi:hypothetical protein
MRAGPRILALPIVLLLVTGCAPRVNLSTGTTIGLKATPGDGSTRPPQVTLGYKRAEVSLVPTEGKGATATGDAVSTLASIHFKSQWFGHTDLDSFIATGLAAQRLVQADSVYVQEVARVTLGVVSDAIQARRKKLADRIDNLSDSQAKTILDHTGYTLKTGQTAKESLRDYVLDAQTEPLLERLESAFDRQS